MSQHLHIIANPNAAGGKGRRAVPRLRRLLEDGAVSFRMELTAGPGHAADLAREAAEEGVDRLLVVGGDGTLHEVANGLLDSGAVAPALAVCPVGTGNDFYRMVRAPSDLAGAMNTALFGRCRAFEVGMARWEGGQEHFVNLLGVGIDVEVLRRRSRFRGLPGLSQYLAALLSAAKNFRHQHMIVALEDEAGEEARMEARALLAAVTVGPSVGGGFFLSPDARPDDGLLDLFLVEELGLLGILRHLPRVVRGTHGTVPEIHMKRLRRARLESADGAPFHFELDGELMPQTTPWLEIEVLPGRLQILESAPQNGSDTPS